MWTYLLGPFLSLFPEPWRAKLPWAESIRWRPATFISGSLEALLSLCALVVWYSYSVTHHTPIQLEQALRAHPNVHPNEMMMGLLGYVFVALNPVTWIICWFWFEGVIRALGAAFTEEIVELSRSGSSTSLIVPSASGARIATGRRLCPTRLRRSETVGRALMIMSCQPKPTWQDRPIIHFQGEFFRVERSLAGTGLRPYVYHLPAIATRRNCSRPGKLRPGSGAPRAPARGERLGFGLPCPAKKVSY